VECFENQVCGTQKCYEQVYGEVNSVKKIAQRGWHSSELRTGVVLDQLLETGALGETRTSGLQPPKS